MEPSITNVVKHKFDSIEQSQQKDKQELIQDLLMEFIEESTGLINDKTLKEQLKILKKILGSYL